MLIQFQEYLTFENIYLYSSYGILPFWFVLIIFPQSQICRVFITSIFPIFILSLIYGYLLYINFYNDFDLLTNFELYLGMAKLFDLFSDSLFLILFWTHFLAINLFCGGWMVKDSQKFNIGKLLMFFPLIITYLIGPIGLTIYWIIRIFYSKRISLYD